MNEQQIQMAVANRRDDGTLRVSAVIDGKIVVFNVARHVAASIISALSEALAKEDA